LFWKKPSFKIAAAAGVFTGLIAYTYFHYLAYWGSAVGILFLYALIFERKNKEFFKGFLIFGGVALVMAVPYLLNYWQFKNFAGVGDSSLRYGIAQGRSIEVFLQPARNYLIAVLFGLGAYLLYWKNERRKAVFLGGLALAMILVFNLQFITGFMPVPGQSQKAIAPIVFLLGMILFYDLIIKFSNGRPLFRKVVSGILVLAVILIPLKKIVNVLAIWKPSDEVIGYYRFSGDIVDSWDWINKNLSREPRIVSSSLITSLYLSAYTSARPSLATGFASSMPMTNLEQRYLEANKLFGISDDVLLKRLTESLNDCVADCPPNSWYNFHKDYRFLYVNYFYRGAVLKGGVASFPENYLNDLAQRYESLKIGWKDIGAEYVYYGPWEKQFSQLNLKKDKNLDLIYQNSLVEIYKIIR